MRTPLGAANTAVGYQALFSNTDGATNTATGYRALFSNTRGTENTATGYEALFNNNLGPSVMGTNNTATGSHALFNNTYGGGNTAVGKSTLEDSTTGSSNTGIGVVALENNTTGSLNVGVGGSALGWNTTGDYNTGIGTGAGRNVSTASFVTCIGADVPCEDISYTTWIANVYGVTTQSGMTAPVIVSDGGQLGILASSERFKKDIATMDKTSEAILSLRPVTFHYKTDTKGTPQFGLIAEEVAKVNPALVLPDKEGKPYTVRYDAVNAMLLNEFLKEHRKNEEQQKQINVLTAQLNEQAAQIQKVSAQLEASRPAPQMVNNP